jgi:hypothetical protein
MAHLGIEVTGTSVRSVLMRRTRIVWHGCVQLEAGESLGCGVERLLAMVPRGEIGRFAPRVVVAIGLAHSQLKQLDGLPAMKHRTMLSRVLRENSASFFLRTGARIVVSDVEHRVDGTNWAAAFDADVIEDVLAALRRRGIARPSIVPYAAALTPLLQSGSHQLTEGDVVVRLTIAEGAVKMIRRCTGAVPSGGLLVSPAAVVVAQSVGADYLAAYGAATAARNSPFAWHPEPDASRTRRRDRVRIAAASLLLVAAATAALFAPGVRARRTTTQASRELATNRSAQINAARVEGTLRRVSEQLERIEGFRGARGQMTMLLGAISQALPESTAMLSLRVDTLEGTFVALTPHAADVLPELATVDAIASARIIGSVTRETQGQARVERATVRFRRQRVAAAPAALGAAPRRGER